MLIFQSDFSHLPWTDKQQPLTLVKYIVFRFKIYIHSVNVVVTLCLCENVTEQERFNNALRFLVFDNHSEINGKDSKKR